MTYPLGWSVVPRVLVHRERWPGGYKVTSVPLVVAGQEVVPDQPVLRVIRADAAERVDFPSHLSLPSVTTKIHLQAIRGEIQASQVQGQGELVPAGLYGQVVDVTPRGGVVIESRAAVIQGVLGVGFQVAGVLTMWQGNGERRAEAIPPGALLVVPGPLSFALLRQAMSSGIAGVIASSIKVHDFEGFLRTDLVQLLNSRDVERSQVYLPPLTILLTEGLGNATMPARVLNLLKHYQGAFALLTGITSVQQHRSPELVISLPAQESKQDWQPTKRELQVLVGALVRICSGEYEGMVGEVDYLFLHQQVFPSGIRAMAVRLRLEDGALLIVPITQVERIG